MTWRGFVTHSPGLAAIRLSSVYVLSGYLIVNAIVMIPALFMDLVDDYPAFLSLIIGFFIMLALTGLIDLSRTDQTLEYSKRGPRENRATKVALVSIGIWFVYFLVAILMF